MLKNVISMGDFAIWPQLSLIMFLVTFVGILIWTSRRKAKPHYNYMADLVLNDAAENSEVNHGQ